MNDFDTRTYTRTRVATGLTVCLLMCGGSRQSEGTQGGRAKFPGNPSVRPAVRAVLDAVRADEPQVAADQIRLCEIPAPPFKEAARAGAMRSAFEQIGLANVRVDRAGNVLGERAGVSPQPRLVVAAHVDTVFPEETDVHVTRSGTVLKGPGIGDNCRGLAVLLAVARALQRSGLQTDGPITFVANTGEEGLGDLRGAKALFNDTLKGRVDRFMAIDGAGLYLANTAVGSRRYRVTFKGPGGHSYAAFGTANPIQAMGRAIAAIARLPVPGEARTTFNVGRVGGGTSINAIPTECWMEVDLRSTDAAALAALEAQVTRAADDAAAEENRRGGVAGAITVVRQLVGDRPPGRTPAGSPIVQTALAAARALGLTLTPTESSTDANVPIQLKIPAIAIGTGGRSTGPHTANETYDTTDAWRGTQFAALTVVMLAGR